jgi:hypothetical protein
MPPAPIEAVIVYGPSRVPGAIIDATSSPALSGEAETRVVAENRRDYSRWTDLRASLTGGGIRLPRPRMIEQAEQV